jgi:ribosome-associated protein
LSAVPAVLNERILRALEEKKGLDILLLDVRDQISYTDYLVLCTGTSGAHVHTLVSVLEDMKGPEGPVYVTRSKDNSWWILDFVDVVVHVFKAEARSYYDLESFWGDAKRVMIAPEINHGD